ncbi:hypothetical protein BJ875DRAFT_469887 [Amylocarpus encephaloides]|uniref:Uncharacterized protein n=1 Tax=Amylocarpus encephaloides TaxID=45428 RepID=A0A9P7YCQ0_9HELO|nr:hypothetical protein BJ875DRAFT_469887 [Amylocarpus encephaloides]
MPEMSQTTTSPFTSSTVSMASLPLVAAEPPPPPYTPSSAAPIHTSSTNPGFCPLAFSERHANKTPGGGMTAAQYFAPCPACGTVVQDAIPGTYKEGWRDWVDPSVNFRWESHVPPPLPGSKGEMVRKPKAARMSDAADLDLERGLDEGEREERLGCWICWEYEQKWEDPMGPEVWYAHMRKHFRNDGFRVCVGKTGGMQRRRNCGVKECPKIHS